MKIEFWHGRRVLLTGHTGFKGSWLSLWLQSMGSHLCGLSLKPPTQPALFDVLQLAKGMEHHIADIRNYSTVEALMREFQPEIVIHMAAQPLVRLSYDQPIETYQTNVMGTINVLEAVRNSATVKTVINVTTDKCYENKEWIWGYREDERMGGHDPYSNSKACAELVSSAYRKSFLEEAGIALATVRAGNVIGGGDWAKDRLIPDIFRAIEKGEPALIRNPHAVRPWQHVLESLSGYLTLAEHLHLNGQTYAEGWNFGPNSADTKPVQWIVEHICREWAEGATWRVQPGDHPHEANSLMLDISKSKARLNWSPRWPLETALTHITNWQRAWLSGENMKQVCINQISDYYSCK